MGTTIDANSGANTGPKPEDCKPSEGQVKEEAKAQDNKGPEQSQGADAAKEAEQKAAQERAEEEKRKADEARRALLKTAFDGKQVDRRKLLGQDVPAPQVLSESSGAGASIDPSRLPERVPSLKEAAAEIQDKLDVSNGRMDPKLAAQLGAMRASDTFKGASPNGLPVFFKNMTAPGGDPTRPDAQVYTYLQRNPDGKEEWRTFEVAGTFSHAYNEMFPGKAGTNSPLGLPTSGREEMKDGPYAGKRFQNFENGKLVEVEPGVIQRLDTSGKPVGEAWKDPKPVDLDKAVKVPEPGQEVGGANGVGPTGANRVQGKDLNAEDIRRIIGQAEKARGADFSPLNDGDMPEYIVAVSKETGVPVWLLLSQAQNETSFGSGARDGYRPPSEINNVTVSDGQPLFDPQGRAAGTGNAHNLFNIRPGGGWKGNHIETGAGGPFRAYGDFKESIRDYANLMANNYKGLTVDQLVNKYYPAGDGDNKPERYINSILSFAQANGISVNRNSVPIGQSAQPTNITTAGAGSSRGTAGTQAKGGAGATSSYEIPGADQALEYANNPPPNPMSGDGSWHYWCLGLVNKAYQSAGRPIPELAKPTAYESYLAYKSEGQIRQDFPPPKGAIVFYDWKSGGQNIGHIGISKGDGTYVGTATSGAPTVTRDIRSPSYLGWAYPTPADAKAADAAPKTAPADGLGGSVGADPDDDVKRLNPLSTNSSPRKLDPKAVELAEKALQDIRYELSDSGKQVKLAEKLAAKGVPSDLKPDYQAHLIKLASKEAGGSLLLDAVNTAFNPKTLDKTASQRATFVEAFHSALEAGTFSEDTLRKNAASGLPTRAAAWTELGKELGIDQVGRAGDPSDVLDPILTPLQQYKDALEKRTDLDKKLTKELSNFGLALTPEQRNQYIADFQKKYESTYTTEVAEKADALAKALGKNKDRLLDAAVRDPTVRDQLFDTLKTLADSPRAKEALQMATDILAAEDKPLGSIFDRQKLMDEVLDPAMKNAASELFVSAGSPEGAIEQLKAIVEPLKNAKDVFKGASEAKEAFELLDDAAAGRFDKLAKLAEDGEKFAKSSKALKAFALGGVIFGAAGATGDLGKKDYAKAIKGFGEAGKDGAELLAKAFTSWSNGQKLAAGLGLDAAKSASFLTKIAPGLGLVANTASLFDHFKQLGKEKNIFLATAALGDMIGVLGSAVQYIPGGQVPGAIISGIGGALAAGSDILAGLVTDGITKDEERELLRKAGVPDSAIEGLVQSDGNRIKQLTRNFGERVPGDGNGSIGLGLSPEQVQELSSMGLTNFLQEDDRLDGLVDLKAKFALTSDEVVQLVEAVAKSPGNWSADEKLTYFLSQTFKWSYEDQTAAGKTKEQWLKRLKGAGYKEGITRTFLEAADVLEHLSRSSPGDGSGDYYPTPTGGAGRNAPAPVPY